MKQNLIKFNKIYLISAFVIIVLIALYASPAVVSAASSTTYGGYGPIPEETGLINGGLFTVGGLGTFTSGVGFLFTSKVIKGLLSA